MLGTKIGDQDAGTGLGQSIANAITNPDRPARDDGSFTGQIE